MRSQRESAASHTGIFIGRIEQWKGCSWGEARPRNLPRNALQHAEHRVVFGENALDGIGNVNPQWLQFAQQQQSQNMIDVGVRENRTGDWRLAHPFVRMEFGSAFDLRAQIRRSSK